MEAFLVAMITVAVAEFGDKSQLLVLVLARSFRQPLSLAAGLACAALAAVLLAAVGGVWLARLLPPGAIGWVAGLVFLAIAAWAFLSRGHREDRPYRQISRRNAFWSAFVVFFLVEFGDKTQATTIGLVMTFDKVLPVVLGGALGMLLINLPVIWLGHRLAPGIRFRWIRLAGGILFALIGLWLIGRELMR